MTLHIWDGGKDKEDEEEEEAYGLTHTHERKTNTRVFKTTPVTELI